MLRWALAAVALGACADDVTPCPGPALRIRNPATLACEEWQALSPTCPDRPPAPTWAACADGCVGIRDEVACLATDGCRPAYDDCILFGGDCYTGQSFVGCFGLDHGPRASGECLGLDAQDCSTREDCAAWFTRGPTCPPGQPYLWQPNGEKCVLTYASCQAKPTTPVDG